MPRASDLFPEVVMCGAGVWRSPWQHGSDRENSIERHAFRNTAWGTRQIRAWQRILCGIL
ncbi:hypothetical protein M407DRAFT_123894 [Tulasnella calospora MUT 4182]|uniref:Uncharacterized protein n=1 Tax=Tulasnella calospora MUT 4182 TaxID=1051891 RepID=A0A0C3QA76_9AGAM|nr:hypothetical protein M407DRAFT_123894 [Tulasnella calospora MUT 4182]